MRDMFGCSIFNFFLTCSNSSKYPDNAMPGSDVVEKSSGPNGQTAALEREIKQLRDQLCLQKDEQAQKKRSASPSMQQAKRTKRNNHQNYPSPHVSVGANSMWSHGAPPPACSSNVGHVSVGDNSMRSLGAPSPACSSNVGISDNRQVMLDSNHMVSSRNNLLSPKGHNVVTSSTHTLFRSRSCDVWTVHFCNAHNDERLFAENLRSRDELLDGHEVMYAERVELLEIRCANLNNDIQELAEKMEKKRAEVEKCTLNHDMSMDLLICAREAKAANATDLIEAERVVKAMAWIYKNDSSRHLNHSERLTKRCSILRNLNQAQLQKVFQTFCIKDFQSMNFDELCRNYTQVLIRGGHEKKDIIRKAVRATAEQRKSSPYSREEELKHILVDIFGFGVVPHSPVTNHH